MIIDGELGMSQELGKIPQGQFGNGSYWLNDRSGQSQLSTDSHSKQLQSPIRHALQSTAI